MIKLVAFDVDGTLRDRDYLPDSTRKAVRKLKEQGITVVLCTGRCEYELVRLREELGIDWAVTCNGSHIGYQGSTRFGTPFPKETVQAWLREAEASKHALLLYGAESMYITRENDVFFRQAQKEIGFMEPVLLKDSEEVPDIYQCIVFCDEESEHKYIGPDRARYYLHRWRTWAIDINPTGTNKAVGLRKLIGLLGFSMDEVAAFGDGLNDLEMLESVGTGIAMGNAGDELKRKARFVTKSLHEDGIALAVDEWIVGSHKIS